MTKKFKFALMAAGLIAGASLSSCSNENSNEPSLKADGNLLVKSPEMIAYSSNHVWSKYGITKADEVQDEEKPYISMNDVEINLSVNEKIEGEQVTNEGETFTREDYISSHLSLHVRTPRDVKVYIPVPAEYYCPADDMEIVKKHIEDHFVYGDQNHELKLNVNGSDVKVNVDYSADGITITTSGINQNVIDFLAEEYKDGITFEIWNYFNATLSREELQQYLNRSTVEFIGGDDNVDYYVNAFNELKEVDEEGNVTSSQINKWDCTVSIIGDQSGNFDAIVAGSEEYLNGFHGYNGSSFNKVFVHKKSIEE